MRIFLKRKLNKSKWIAIVTLMLVGHESVGEPISAFDQQKNAHDAQGVLLIEWGDYESG